MPEIWKRRPALVISHRDHHLKGTCLVLPVTTKTERDNTRWCYTMPDYAVKVLGEPSLILCSYPITVAVSRLEQVKGSVVMMQQDDFNKVLALVREWMPEPQ
jgi:mRNA-degrading endonuclease toxin of MazEF toxin-antitoxin module